MTAGLLYKCRWRTNQWNYERNSWDRGWDMLLFIGVETIHREDGMDIHNYRFHDVIKNQEILMDAGLTRHCEEIKGDSHERD